MSFSEVNIELFRRYLASELDQQELDEFQERLSNNSEFNSEFESFLEFERSIQDAEIIDTYDKIGAWEVQNKDVVKPVRRKIISLTFIGSAAAIIILFIVFKTGPSDNIVISDFFEPYENIISVRGKKEKLDQGLSYYDQKKYQKAIEQFEEFQEDPIAIFYTAEALMAQGKYKMAIQKYDEILNGESIFDEVSIYHKSIALIGLNKNREAKELLKTISKSSKYYDSTRDLLSRL